MTHPTFTIVATVWNEKNSIASFVDSLLGQSVNADEIIIVDGASNDGTLEILKTYEADNKIKLLSERCNIAEGRNLGIGQAESDYIAVTDAGCIVDMHWLEALKNTATNNPDADVIAGNFYFKCLTEFELASVYATFNPDREKSDTAIYYPSSRSLAFKKSAWEKVKGYPEWIKVSEDTLYNIRLRQIGCKFVFARDAIVNWRPRRTWRALAKQRFNFARCNSQVGHGMYGYKLNMLYHAAIILPLLLSFFSGFFALLALPPIYYHIKNNLWKQADYATAESQQPMMRWRVLSIMEFIRLTNILGFSFGQFDRFARPELIKNQLDWMDAETVIIPKNKK